MTPGTFARRHIPPHLFDTAFEYVVAGEEIDRDGLLSNLVNWGYNSVSVVEDPGTFSVRGGIIDVYSPYLSLPVRIDLFGDEVESLRLFDPATQRTKHALDDAILLPAREIIFRDDAISSAKSAIAAIADEATIPSRRLSEVYEDIENKIHFFGIESLLPLFHENALVTADAYLPDGDDVVYLLGDKEGLATTWDDTWTDGEVGYAHAVDDNEIALPVDDHLADGSAVLIAVTEGRDVVEMPELSLRDPRDKAPVISVGTEPTNVIRSEIIKATRSGDADADILAPLTNRLLRWRKDGLMNLLVCQTRGQAERLKSLLEPKNLQVRLLTDRLTFDELFDPESKLRDRSIHAWIVRGEATQGFVIPSAKIAVITEEELFGQRMKRRRSRKPAAGAFVSDLAELKAGDFVVHIDHGIGLYHGMTRLAVNGVDGTFSTSNTGAATNYIYRSTVFAWFKSIRNAETVVNHTIQTRLDVLGYDQAESQKTRSSKWPRSSCGSTPCERRWKVLPSPPRTNDSINSRQSFPSNPRPISKRPSTR